MAQFVLLLNGALDGEFRPFRDDKNLVVCAGWTPWWQEAGAEDANWKNRQPAFSSFALDNRQVQQVSTPWGTHVAGLWQQVPAAAENRYEFTVEGQAWSSEDPSPATQLEASDVNLQIGVDPTGGTDPESPLIIWSERAQPLCQWESLHLTVEAEASILTVFLRSSPSLPKRQQSIFWRNAFLRPIGRYKRAINIVGAGDTHINVTPEQPAPGAEVKVEVSSTRLHKQVGLMVLKPDHGTTAVLTRAKKQEDERHIWSYAFRADMDGLYELRFVGDEGARLLALRLLRVARDVQIVPSQSPLEYYKRIYVLLPPTADRKWFEAAARGSFDGRYTIGFSADDAGMGDFENRQVLAVNPHHWPEVLTSTWFEQHYPGVVFTAVVANTPQDLENWLKNWMSG
ncbi:MAG: hypothetical protein H6658_02555 [Ardenticatenaceae bacterium]|nr:hypothetical protein [Ardenticatenaceae bacterium]